MNCSSRQLRIAFGQRPVPAVDAAIKWRDTGMHVKEDGGCTSQRSMIDYPCSSYNDNFGRPRREYTPRIITVYAINMNSIGDRFRFEKGTGINICNPGGRGSA